MDYTANMTIPSSSTTPGNLENITAVLTTEVWYYYDYDMDFYQTPQLIFLWVLFVVIVTGNCCVLAAIRLSETGRKTRMNFFIMHLAIADLSVGVVHVLTDIIWKTTIAWHAGNVMCKIVRYSQGIVMFASTYVLVSLSIDRFDAIARPMNFSKSAYRARMLIYLAWLTSALFAVPLLFVNSLQTRPMVSQCWMDFPEEWHWKLYTTMITTAAFFIPAIIIAVCYAVIVSVICRKSRNRSENINGALPSNRQRTFCTDRSRRADTTNNRSKINRGVIPQAKIRTIKMTLIIVLVFIFCWSPYCIYNLLDTYDCLPENTEFDSIGTFFQSLAPLNSAANPIIYGVFSTRICRNLRRIRPCYYLSKICCNCRLNVRRYRGSAKRMSHATTSLTDHTHYTTDFNSRRSSDKHTKGKDRRPSGLPLVRRTLSETDNQIMLTYSQRHIPVNLDIEAETPNTTELL